MMTDLVLTPEIALKIEGFVRAGTGPVSAAKAAGIDRATFNFWMQQAESGPGAHSLTKRHEKAPARGPSCVS